MTQIKSRLRRWAVAWLYASLCGGVGIAHAAVTDQPVGAVFTTTNSADPARGNEVVYYQRYENGSLRLVGYFPTGGRGSGPAPAPGERPDPLGSQGLVTVSADRRLLFTANAGSDDISVFKILPAGLTLVDRVSSGGFFPTSLTLHGDLLYVVNTGGDGNIAGFRVASTGTLTPISGSARDLQLGNTNPPASLEAPGQILFSPNGRLLTITIKQIVGTATSIVEPVVGTSTVTSTVGGLLSTTTSTAGSVVNPVLDPVTGAVGVTNQTGLVTAAGSGAIYFFSVDSNGLPSAVPAVNPGSGEGPFAALFDGNNRLLVAEAQGAGVVNAPLNNAGSASSYFVSSNGTLQAISKSIPNNEGATCWIVKSGPYIYLTDTLTNAISVYLVGADGGLTLLPDAGVVLEPRPIPTAGAVDSLGYVLSLTPTGGAVPLAQVYPLDEALSADGKFLYVVQPGNGTIGVFSIDQTTGKLTSLGDVPGLIPLPEVQPTERFSPIGGSPAGLAAY